MEDKRYLAVFEDMNREILETIINHQRAGNGDIIRESLIQRHRKLCDDFTEIIRRHRRVIDFQDGKSPDPEVHFGESVLLGVGGQP